MAAEPETGLDRWLPVSPEPVLAFAKLTIKEATRRRLLLAVVLLTVVVIGVTGWGFSTLWNATGPGGAPLGVVEVRLIAAGVLIPIVFLFEGVLALMAVLVAAPSISGDVETNLALALLARPVRRSEMVLGKWLGLAALIVGYSVAAGVLELAVVDWATGYIPPDPFSLVLYVALVGLALLTITMLLSTRLAGMTAGIIPLIGYFMAFVGGALGGVGSAIGNQELITAGVISKLVLPTFGLWQGAVYAIEPATVVAGYRAAGAVAAANPFGATDPPPASFLVWTAFWFVAVLALTLWSFRHREI
jgi:ABC-type transport system involved in multi-copper enzyme maturation permease subunit